MSVPSLVSINNRGPLSGSASAAGGLVAARAVVFLLVERLLPAAGLLSDLEVSSVAGSVFPPLFVAVSSGLGSSRSRVLGVAGRRPRLFPGDAFGLVVLVAATDDSADVGSGVGAVATAEGGGAGSSILAPTDETRLPVVLLDVVADTAA
jgi:hypothetical protein